MRSYPVIQSSLSATQQEFILFVERFGARAALYETDADSGLYGDTVRMRMKENDADVSERRHTLEFLSLTGEGHWATAGCIGHSLKDVEAMQGPHVAIESTFEIVGLGVQPGQFARAEVEPIVQAQLDKLKAARLLPLAYRRTAHDPSPRPQDCA